MASYTGTSIFSIITSNRIPDDTHTFTAGGQSLGSVEVMNFYGNQTVTSATVNSYFTDVTSAQDNIMCLRIFHGNLDIQSGTFTPPHRTKGLFIFVKGNLTNSGTISMTGKGASGTKANVYLWGSEFIPADGQAGATGVSTGSAGGNLSVAGGSPDVQSKPKPARGTGGGGSGSVRRVGSTVTTVTSAAGSTGTSWSGGFGSGGISSFNSGGTQVGNAPTSTIGGDAKVTSSTSQAQTIFVGGGSGVLGGDGVSRGGTNTIAQPNPPSAAADGTAGTLMIACLGTYTNSGIVSSVGTSGGTGSADHGNGGASGGGSINIIAKSIGGTGTSSVTGGVGTTAGSDAGIGDNTGGAGGAGSHTARTFTQESITTFPRRTLFYSGTTLYFYDFENEQWKPATGSGSAPYETYGMFDAELSALTLEDIDNLPGYTANAVKIRTYTPS